MLVGALWVNVLDNADNLFYLHTKKYSMDARMDSIYHIVFSGNNDGTATFLLSF